jgi:hypothetical protein
MLNIQHTKLENRMVIISMMKPKWILEWCWKCFYSGLHMTLEGVGNNTKLSWPVSGCITMSLVSTLQWRVEKKNKQRKQMDSLATTQN